MPPNILPSLKPEMTSPPASRRKPRGRAGRRAKVTFSYFASSTGDPRISVASSRSAQPSARLSLDRRSLRLARLGRRSLRLASVLIGAASGSPRLGSAQPSARLECRATRSRGRKCRGKVGPCSAIAASPHLPHRPRRYFRLTLIIPLLTIYAERSGHVRSRRRCSFGVTPCASWSPRPSSAKFRIASGRKPMLLLSRSARSSVSDPGALHRPLDDLPVADHRRRHRRKPPARAGLHLRQHRAQRSRPSPSRSSASRSGSASSSVLSSPAISSSSD